VQAWKVKHARTMSNWPDLNGEVAR